MSGNITGGGGQVLTFTEVNGSAFFNANNNTWQDKDLSATIGTDAKFAFILIKCVTPSGGSLNAGVRKNGSAENRYHLAQAGATDDNYDFHLMVVEPASGVIETYSTDNSKITFYLVGYAT